MPDAEGSMIAGLKPCATAVVAQAFRPAILATGFALLFVVSAAAQDVQPTVVAAPQAPEFLTRYDFHLSIARLITEAPTPAPVVPDERFSWDARFGGSFDIVDLV